MNNHGGHWLGQALVALVVITACVRLIGPVVPHLVGPAVVVGVVIIAIRVAFSRTRPW